MAVVRRERQVVLLTKAFVCPSDLDPDSSVGDCWDTKRQRHRLLGRAQDFSGFLHENAPSIDLMPLRNAA